MHLVISILTVISGLPLVSQLILIPTKAQLSLKLKGALASGGTHLEISIVMVISMSPLVSLPTLTRSKVHTSLRLTVLTHFVFLAHTTNKPLVTGGIDARRSILTAISTLLPVSLRTPT